MFAYKSGKQFLSAPGFSMCLAPQHEVPRSSSRLKTICHRQPRPCYCRTPAPPADCSVSALHAATLGSAVLTPECHSAGRILSLRTARLVSYWSNRSHQRARSLAIRQGDPLINAHDYSLRNPRNAVSAGWLSRQPAPKVAAASTPRSQRKHALSE